MVLFGTGAGIQIMKFTYNTGRTRQFPAQFFLPFWSWNLSTSAAVSGVGVGSSILLFSWWYRKELGGLNVVATATLNKWQTKKNTIRTWSKKLFGANAEQVQFSFNKLNTNVVTITFYTYIYICIVVNFESKFQQFAFNWNAFHHCHVVEKKNTKTM